MITGGPHFPLTSGALKKVLSGSASHEVLLSIAHAVGAIMMSHAFISIRDMCCIAVYVDAYTQTQAIWPFFLIFYFTFPSC